MRRRIARRGDSDCTSRCAVHPPDETTLTRPPLQAVFSRRLDLIDSRVKGSALELQNRLLEDCEELREQIEKQVDRLGELKLKQEQNPCKQMSSQEARVGF